MCGGRQARRCDTLEELLAAADVVSIHTTLDDDSHHMMNAETFGQMKRGSYFVNAARGELVDEDAMVAALESGHLAGAGIDVGPNDVWVSFAERTTFPSPCRVSFAQKLRRCCSGDGG